MKRFLLIVTSTVLFTFGILNLALAAPVDATLPDSVSVFVEVQLEESIRDFILAEFELEKSYDKKYKPTDIQHIVTQKIRDNTKFFGGFAKDKSIIFGFPITDTEFVAATKNLKFNEHPLTKEKIYLVSDGLLISANGYAFFIINEELEQPPLLDEILNISKGTATNSLDKNLDYKNTKFSTVDETKAIFNLYMNLVELLNIVPSEIIADIEANGILSASLSKIVGLAKLHRMDIQKNSDGYQARYELHADEAIANELNYKMDIQNFTPTLYKQLPPQPIIAYFNASKNKDAYEQSQRILKVLNPEGDYALAQASALYYGLTGIKLEDLLKLNGEWVSAFQYDQTNKMPYFTTMISLDDAEQVAIGKDLTTKITKLIEDALKKNTDTNLKITVTKDATSITKIHINLNDNPELIKDLPFKSMDFTFGVTDNLLIFSNYNGIHKSIYRTGVGTTSPNFTAFAEKTALTANLNGSLYISLRTLWDYVDGIVMSQKTPNLKDLAQFYSFIEKVYPWKEITYLGQGYQYKGYAEISVAKDSSTHQTFAEYLKTLKESDSDNDGYSDYEELSKYKTDPMKKDGDIEKIGRGEKLDGSGKLFSDVPEAAFYTKDVGLLYRHGALSGYPDGTFQPGRNVNRAEFTAMVMSAFHKSKLTKTSGSLLEFTYGQPFIDIDNKAWYAQTVLEAQSLGIINGSKNNNGETVFRPGDSISRAEAIAILNKAAAILSTDLADTKCDKTLFNDVDEKAWYCKAVTNAYKHGITKGRSAGVFAPNGVLNRAEAAVMIARTFEINLDNTILSTPAFGSEILPLLPSLIPNL